MHNPKRAKSRLRRTGAEQRRLGAWGLPRGCKKKGLHEGLGGSGKTQVFRNVAGICRDAMSIALAGNVGLRVIHLLFNKLFWETFRTCYRLVTKRNALDPAPEIFAPSGRKSFMRTLTSYNVTPNRLTTLSCKNTLYSKSRTQNQSQTRKSSKTVSLRTTRQQP